MTSTIGVKKIQYPNGTDILTLDSSGTLAIGGNITSNITTTGTVNTPSINGGQIGGRRNLAYNGAMTVAQRGTSFSGITSSQYTLDRVKIFMNGAGTYTVSQSTDVPSGQGFYNSFKLDNTTSDNFGTAGDYVMIRLNSIEQQDVMKLNYGGSSAEKVTVSFWAKFSYADTWNIALINHVAQRSNFKPFTISSANTWQKIVLTFDGDTNSGDGFGISTALGLSIDLWLGAGSSYSGGSATAGVWDERSNNNTSLVPASTDFGSSTDHEMYITGLQLEIGEQATSFEHRSFGEELALCQRYFYAFADGRNGNDAHIGTGTYYTSNAIFSNVKFPVSMRTKPTLESTTGTNYYIAFRNGAGDHFDEIITFSNHTTTEIAELKGQTNVSGTAGHGTFLRLGGTSTSARLFFDAEL